MGSLFPGKTISSHLARKALVAEAAVYLLAARWAVRFIPYRHIERFMNRTSSVPEIQGDEREKRRKMVRWAIRRAGLLLPGATVCLPRGIAAQAILRRRGITATLHYGLATQPDNTLASHVWVRDGAEPVTGCRMAGGFRQLAVYPQPGRVVTTPKEDRR